MKRLAILISTLAMTSSLMVAQNEGDLFLSSSSILTGTARSMALSNAMGAAGGDLSALSINPAGIAVYRGSEFVYSQGLNFSNTSTNYYNTTRDDSQTSFPLQTLGFVGTYKPMREVKSGIVSSHFGFSYNRINNFNQNITLEGNNVPTSMLDMFVIGANGRTPDDLNTPGDPGFYTSNLAYLAYLIEPLPGSTNQYYNTFEDFTYDSNTNSTTDFSFRPIDGLNQKQIIDTRGYTGEYSITGGVNISNFLMLGGSLNFQNIRYDRNTVYRESYYDIVPSNHPINPNGEIKYYDFYETRSLYGNSVNGKFGVIIKPFHMLRVALAYHTPNAYQMHESYDTYIDAYLTNGNNVNVSSGINQYDYTFQTPYKLAGSAAIVLGNFALITADLEYQDYSRSKFKSNDRNFVDDEYFQDFNNIFETKYQPAYTLKAGVEIKPVSFLMLRAGAGLYTSPVKSDYVTEPMNTLTASCGLGYRDEDFYVDIALMGIYKEEDYYPYNVSGDENYPQLEPARIQSLDYRGAITVGFKF